MKPVNEKPRRDILVIGKTQLTDEEEDLVHSLGFLIGLSGNPLHTTKSKGTAQAVAAGYRTNGLQPHTHAAKLRDVDAHTVVVLDDDFQKRLDKAFPEWTSKDWDLLDNLDTLHGYLSMLAGVLANRGLSLA